ncbi:protein of unknown function [Burkholderia multivorans]
MLAFAAIVSGNGISATISRHSWDVVISDASFMVTLFNDKIRESLAFPRPIHAPDF